MRKVEASRVESDRRSHSRETSTAKVFKYHVKIAISICIVGLYKMARFVDGLAKIRSDGSSSSSGARGKLGRRGGEKRRKRNRKEIEQDRTDAQISK